MWKIGTSEDEDPCMLVCFLLLVAEAVFHLTEWQWDAVLLLLRVCETGFGRWWTQRWCPPHSGGEVDTMLYLIQETHFITLGCPHWDTFSHWYIVHYFRNIQDSRWSALLFWVKSGIDLASGIRYKYFLLYFGVESGMPACENHLCFLFYSF